MTSLRATALWPARRSGAALVVAAMVFTSGPTRAGAAPADEPPERAPARAQTEAAPDGESPESDAERAEPNTDGPDAAKNAPADQTSSGPAADPLREQLIEEAALHFQEATRLVNGGDYESAALEFERSYSAIRTDQALFNAGLSYEKAGQPVQAIRIARRYLELADCDAPEAEPMHCARRREEVQQAVRRLMRRVGVLTLVIEPGVEIGQVRVQDRTVPLEDFPLVLEPGPVEVTISGLQPDERQVRVARLTAGDETRLYVAPFDEPRQPVVRDPTPPVTDPPRVDPARRQEILRGVFWGSLSATLASGAALAALGGATLYHKQRFEEENFDGATSYPHDHERLWDSLLTPTSAMIGVTAGLAMVTTVVGLFAFSKRQQPGQRASTRTTSVRWRFTPAGVTGRF